MDRCAFSLIDQLCRFVFTFTEEENFKTIEFISLVNVILMVQLSIFALLLCLIFEQFIFTRLCNVVLLEIIVGLLMYHGQSMQMKHGIAQLLNLTDSTAQTGKTNHGGIQLSRSNSFVSVDISETAIGTDNGRTPVVMTISTRRLSSPVPVSSPEIQATELDVSTCSSSRSSSDLEHHHQQSENKSRREEYSFGKAVNEFDKL